MIENFKLFYTKHKKYFFILGSLMLLILFGKLLFENSSLIIDGIIAIREADKLWVIFGLFIFFLGVPINSLILILLSYKKLLTLLTIKEQMALLFVSKLLPSGLGQLTLNSYYLHMEGNTKPQTASVVATKATTASIAFILMILFFLIINVEVIMSVVKIINFDNLSIINIIIFLIIILGIVFLIVKLILRNKKVKNFVTNPINNFKNEILKYKDEPSKLIYSTILAILATLTGMFALWASSNAVGINLTYSEAFFIYSFGNFVAMIIPVPGGIGTTEVGLYAGYSVLGYDPSIFISAILIYRIINYWIPLIVGYLFFFNLRKNILKSFSIKYS